MQLRLILIHNFKGTAIWFEAKTYTRMFVIAYTLHLPQRVWDKILWIPHLIPTHHGQVSCSVAHSVTCQSTSIAVSFQFLDSKVCSPACKIETPSWQDLPFYFVCPMVLKACLLLAEEERIFEKISNRLKCQKTKYWCEHRLFPKFPFQKGSWQSPI